MSLQATPMECNLASMDSVRHLVATFMSSGLQLHVLVNNGAIMASPFALSPDGFEEQWATNYLGHFLLTHLLLPHIRSRPAPARHAPSGAPGAHTWPHLSQPHAGA